jgi:uncharacterized protein
MSALPPKADIAERQLDVRFVPQADIGTFIRSPRRRVRVAWAAPQRLDATHPQCWLRSSSTRRLRQIHDALYRSPHSTRLAAHAAPLVGWSGMRRTIGAISDTHGLLRPQALAALAGCDPIIHAGDVGSPDVLARLGALAPVHAVRGNVDHGAWSASLPVTRRIEIDGFRIYVLHILAELDPQTGDNVDAVIYGHSHQPKIETKNGTLFFNPGSAGPRRFRLPITVGRMTAEHGKLRAEIVELSVKR